MKPNKALLDEIPEVDGKRMTIRGRGIRAKRGVRMSLRALREASGKPQTAIQRDTGMNQGDISRLETRPDFDTCALSTIRRYARAIGGDVELVYVQGDRRITITGPMTVMHTMAGGTSDDDAPESEDAPGVSGESVKGSRPKERAPVEPRRRKKTA